MAGLDIAGFTVESLEAITDRIEAKLEAINPGFDFSPESPDGQLIGIMAFELQTAWEQLGYVYNSYDPTIAEGAALRNIGLITGIPFGTANRSYATVELTGTAGVVVAANSIVTDDEGFEYFVAYDTAIPSNAEVICATPGPVPVSAGTIKNIKNSQAGWTAVAQATDGIIGTLAMTDQEYRNRRVNTVLRNHVGVVDTMKARLHELEIPQVSILNNDTAVAIGSVPANTIHVTVGEASSVTDASIAAVIFETKPAACPTYGSTTVVVEDLQGYSHDVNFTRASAITIEIVVDVTFLDAEVAGAEENILNALSAYINNLEAGADVIYTHLYQYITPYASAQVNTLTVAKQGDVQGVINVPLSDTEYGFMDPLVDITFTET